MELFLLRHGKAVNSHPKGDSARELLEKGRDQSRRVGRLLAATGALPELVLTSPLTRARQTAEEFCEAAGLPGPVTVSWLACGMDPETALTELSAYRDFSSVALVGHEPDLSELVQWILSAPGGTIEMKKASLACLLVNPPTRHGCLKYLIPSKFVSTEK